MSIPVTHLAQEAIAALVDGELSCGAAARAARHLTGCAQCRMAVQAQREAKAALHGTADDVPVPGDLLSRLRDIPFTAEVPGSAVSAGPGGLATAGSSGSWELPLAAPVDPVRPGHARWLRRGVVGMVAGVGLSVAVLASTLPANPPAGVPGTVARPADGNGTEIVPPVVRTLTLNSVQPTTPDGTP